MSADLIFAAIAFGIGVIILLLILRILWHVGSYFRDRHD